MKHLCLIVASLCLVACGESEHQDLREWMKESSKEFRGNIPKLPPVVPYVPAQYENDGRPDPFFAGRIDPNNQQGRSGSGKAGALQPNFEARELRNNLLERYPLESLRMIGFMRINNQSMAVIQVEQHTKQIKVGDYIGQDFGIVINISEREITLRELVQDSAGDWNERTSTLLMQSKEEGKK